MLCLSCKLEVGMEYYLSGVPSVIRERIKLSGARSWDRLLQSHMLGRYLQCDEGNHNVQMIYRGDHGAYRN